MDKLKPYLQFFWNEIKTNHNDSNALTFLNTFWFYLEGETLEYALNHINAIPKPEVEEYIVTYSNNQFSHHNQNEIIELLGNFFSFSSNLKEAISLALQYTRKKPEHLSELIHKILGSLTFDRKDYQIRYYRQTTLFNILYEGLEQDIDYYAPIFFELCKTFLKYRFHHFKGGRKNSFYHYDYAVHNSMEIRSFRKKVWETIRNHFENYPKFAFDVLLSHEDSPREINKDLMEFDLTFVIPIIEEKLDSESFEHAKYLHNKIMWLRRSNISHPKFDDLTLKFTNKIYQTFLKINWDRFRDKEIYNFDDFREYDRLKESEIRDAFIFNSSNEVEEFYENFVYIKTVLNNNENYHRAFDIVIDENIKKNFEIGICFLKKIIEDENKIEYIPERPFKSQIIDKEKANAIWEVITSQDFKNRSLWKLSFFKNLSDEDISIEHTHLLIETIRNTDRAYIYHFEKFARFKKADPNFFVTFLSAIVDQNNNGGVIKLSMDFFDDYFRELEANIGLIKKAYLQQDSLQSGFDFNGKAFLKILKIDTDFLLEYIKTIQSKNRLIFSKKKRELGFVWQVDNIESSLIKVFDYYTEEKAYYGILDHYCNTFFDNLPDEKKEQAELFLIDYAKKNNRDDQKMNIVVEIARGTMKNIFNKILLQHVALNQNVETFSRIWWRGNGGTVYSGNVIIGDIEAADWRKILSIVEQSNTGVELIPIKNQINRNIEYALRNADRERQMRFLERDY